MENDVAWHSVARFDKTVEIARRLLTCPHAQANAAYDRLVARYSAPDTLVAALGEVTAEARRRATAREEAAQGQPAVGIVEQDAADTAVARPSHRPGSQVSSGGSRRASGPVSVSPYGPPRAATAIEDMAAATGALSRPYAMTGGRTRPRYQLAIEALVFTTAAPQPLDALLPEHQRICDLCRETKSVAEISALLSIPLGVARILVADLVEAGLVALNQLGGGEGQDGHPNVTLLKRVLSGLRKL
ncbi:DUF742 domain-containing protein [Streptomyces populi]